MAQSSLYDQTAENRARNKTILWWVLHLSYSDQESEGETEELQFFEGLNYEEKLANYDAMEEEDDEFILNIVAKFSYYVSFWYVSKVNTKDEFEALINATDEEGAEDVDEIIDEVEQDASAEEAPAEEAPAEEAPAEEAPAEEAPAEEAPAEEAPAEEAPAEEAPAEEAPAEEAPAEEAPAEESKKKTRAKKSKGQ